MAEELKHPDAPQDSVMIDQKIGELVQELAPVLQHILEKIEDLSHKVDEQIIGGLTRAYESKQKADRISALKGAHGEKFGDLIGYLGGPMGANEDEFWDALHDRLGQGDSDEESLIQALLEHMGGLRDHYQGKKPEAVVQASGEPEAVQEALETASDAVEAVPETKEEEAPKEEPKEPEVGSAEFFEKAAKGRKSKAK